MDLYLFRTVSKMVKSDEENFFVVLEKLKDGVLDSLRLIENDVSRSDIDGVAAISAYFVIVCRVSSLGWSAVHET